jgi:hypothetical protein
MEVEPNSYRGYEKRLDALNKQSLLNVKSLPFRAQSSYDEFLPHPK